MRARADGASTVEFLHEAVADSHVFWMTGYWNRGQPKIVRWREVEP